VAANGGGPAERRRQEPSDLEVLDGPVHLIGGYDIRIITRLLKWLLDVEGAGRKDRVLAFGRDLRLFTTLSASISNFGRSQAKPDSEYEGRYMIELIDASAFSRCPLLDHRRFYQPDGDQAEPPRSVCWARVRPDLLVYRMMSLSLGDRGRCIPSVTQLAEGRRRAEPSAYSATPAEPLARSFIRI